MAGKSRFASVLFVSALIGAACGGGDPVTTSSSAAAADSPTTTTAVASARASLLDEPLPTVEQLEDAGDCDELNRLLVGVEDENFRVNTDRTLAEEEARAEDAYDTAFDIYYEVFSEMQGDLGCSDLEMMSVLQTASDQRCQAWIDDGHSLDENPLLLNTAHCLDQQT